MGDAQKRIKEMWPEVSDPNWVHEFGLKAVHYIRGCSQMPHFVIVDDNMVEVGKICPVCLREYPLDG